VTVSAGAGGPNHDLMLGRAGHGPVSGHIPVRSDGRDKPDLAVAREQVMGR